MKTPIAVLCALTGFLLASQAAAAQGYGGTNRFGDPRSRSGLRPAPTMPGRPAQPAQPPKLPQVAPGDLVKFNSLATNAAFYFVADTHRNFLWVKTSPTTASNTVNQKVTGMQPAWLVRAAGSSGGKTSAPPARVEAPAAEKPAAPR